MNIVLKQQWPEIKGDNTREMIESCTEVKDYGRDNMREWTSRFRELRAGLQNFRTNYWRKNCEALRQSYLPFISLLKKHENFKDEPFMRNSSGSITLDQLYNLWKKSGMLSTHTDVIFVFKMIYRLKEIHVDMMNILEHFCEATFRSTDMNSVEIRDFSNTPTEVVRPVFEKLERQMILWEEEDEFGFLIHGAVPIIPTNSGDYQRIVALPYKSIGKNGRTNFIDLVVQLPYILDEGHVQLCEPNIYGVRRTFLMWKTWKETMEQNMETIVLEYLGQKYKLGDLISKYRNLQYEWRWLDLQWCVRNYLDICWYGNIFQRMESFFSELLDFY
jgi:hypothetical protein